MLYYIDFWGIVGNQPSLDVEIVTSFLKNWGEEGKRRRLGWATKHYFRVFNTLKIPAENFLALVFDKNNVENLFV